MWRFWLGAGQRLPHLVRWQPLRRHLDRRYPLSRLLKCRRPQLRPPQASPRPRPLLPRLPRGVPCCWVRRMAWRLLSLTWCGTGQVCWRLINGSRCGYDSMNLAISLPSTTGFGSPGCASPHPCLSRAATAGTCAWSVAMVSPPAPRRSVRCRRPKSASLS